MTELRSGIDPWEAVVADLTTTFRVVRRGTEWLGILGANPEGGAPIPVRVERGEMCGEWWLLILVEVCSTTSLSLKEALERNLELAVGSYALEGERVVLRCAQPLTAGSESARMAITRLLEEAGRRRAAINYTAPAEAVTVLFPA